MSNKTVLYLAKSHQATLVALTCHPSMLVQEGRSIAVAQRHTRLLMKPPYDQAALDVCPNIAYLVCQLGKFISVIPYLIALHHFQEAVQSGSLQSM